MNRPGSCIDPDLWFPVNIKIKTNQSVMKGDYLIPSTTDGDVFEVINDKDEVIQTSGILYQAIHDKPDASDKNVTIQAVGSGSHTLGIMGGNVNPGGLCKLRAKKWIAATVADILEGKTLGRYLHEEGSTNPVAMSVDGTLGVVVIL